MLEHRFITKHCHLRFKDYNEGMYSWYDLRHYDLPLPINKYNEVEIKILKTPLSLIEIKDSRKNSNTK